MTLAWIIAGGLWIVALGYLVGLGRAAAVGDRVRLEPDDERCPVCGDPAGVRCCEFGKERAA